MDYDRLRDLQVKFEENPRRYFAPLANEYRKGGQPRRAIEICRAQLAQMPGHMSGQIVYGQSLYEAGEFDEARQVFERALTLDPENLIALRTLGDMSLQSGELKEARRWYTRLLEADPKDTAVIALVSEIDASAEAAPVPTPKNIPAVDTDAGDQPIPFLTDDIAVPAAAAENAPTEPPAAPAHAEASQAAAPPAPAELMVRAESPAPPPELVASPPSEPAPAQEPIVAGEPESHAAAPVASTAPPEGLERHYPVEPAETIAPEVPLGATGLRAAVRKDMLTGTEGLRGTAPESPEPVGTEGLQGKPPALPLAGAKATRSDDEDALDTWTPPPPVTERVQASERAEPPKEERMFSGPAPEPFVNETMAQLYLQQGYRQLALRVYYQLAEARPEDKGLRDRIAQIEAEDRALHPEVSAVPRKEGRSTERPSGEPVSPRSAAVEAPTPGAPPGSEEGTGLNRSPIDSPPSPEPLRRRESIEAPARDDMRPEPEGVAARQPSVKEFFATLGRRRPPRSQGNPGANAHSGNTMPVDSGASLGASAPSASLDQVFAGATVSRSDSRAASRLADAFSGTGAGASRTSPTPPMPTPRVNPRVPQTQESEEDVAKFRAWLDGLTGE